MAAFKFEFKCVEGKTFGKLREDLYLHNMMCTDMIDLQVEKLRLRDHEKSTIWEYFIAEVEAKLEQLALGVSGFKSTVVAPSELLGGSGSAVYEAAVEQFRKAVHDEAGRHGRSEKEKKLVAERERKAKEKEASKTPEQVLADAVRDILVQPKNGQTPGAAPGHNQNKKPKDKKRAKNNSSK